MTYWYYHESNLECEYVTKWSELVASFPGVMRYPAEMIAICTVGQPVGMVNPVRSNGACRIQSQSLD